MKALTMHRMTRQCRKLIRVWCKELTDTFSGIGRGYSNIGWRTALCNFARYSALCRVHLCPRPNLFFSLWFRTCVWAQKASEYLSTDFWMQSTDVLPVWPLNTQTSIGKGTSSSGMNRTLVKDSSSVVAVSGGGDYPTVKDLENAVRLF